MPIFVKRVHIVEAHQWFKNGDHPDDDVWRPYEDTHEVPRTPREGKVVRRYRDPDDNENRVCPMCRSRMKDHGWLDQGVFSEEVCPGSWIVAKDHHRKLAINQEVFESLYIPFKLASATDIPTGTPPQEFTSTAPRQYNTDRACAGCDYAVALQALSDAMGHPCLTAAPGVSLHMALVRYAIDNYILRKDEGVATSCSKAAPASLVKKRPVGPLYDEEKIGDKPQVVEREAVTPDGERFHVTEIDVSTPRSDQERAAMVVGVRAAKKIMRVYDDWKLALVAEANDVQKTDEYSKETVEATLKRVMRIVDFAESWFHTRNEEAQRDYIEDHDVDDPIKFGDYLGLLNRMKSILDHSISMLGDIFTPNHPRALRTVYPRLRDFMREIDHEQAKFERIGFKETISSRQYSTPPAPDDENDKYTF